MVRYEQLGQMLTEHLSRGMVDTEGRAILHPSLKHNMDLNDWYVIYDNFDDALDDNITPKIVIDILGVDDFYYTDKTRSPFFGFTCQLYIQFDNSIDSRARGRTLLHNLVVYLTRNNKVINSASENNYIILSSADTSSDNKFIDINPNDEDVFANIGANPTVIVYNIGFQVIPHQLIGTLGDS